MAGFNHVWVASLMFGIAVAVGVKPYTLPKQCDTEATVGSEAILTCPDIASASKPYGDILSVMWGKGFGPDPNNSTKFILQIIRGRSISPKGDDNDQRFKIDNTFQLQIQKTTMENEGSYWCQVSRNGTGNSDSNTTLCLKERNREQHEVITTFLRTTTTTSSAAYTANSSIKVLFASFVSVFLGLGVSAGGIHR